MSLIADRCKNVAGLIAFAKSVKQEITQGGETFYWVAIGCDADQVETLAAKGFYVITEDATGREGIGWSKRSKTVTRMAA